MSPVDTPFEAEAAEARRLALMARVRSLESEMLGANRKVVFAEIRDRYPDLAEALFRGRDIRMTDFRNGDLSFIDFRGSDLTGCEFANATIRGARFEFAKVSRDVLSRAQDWDAYSRGWQPVPVSRQGEPLDPVFFLRKPGERFGLSPHLPELVTLDHDMVGLADTPTREESVLLARGQLAIAVRPVTNAEFAYALGEEGLLRPDASRNVREIYSISTYLAGVNRDPARFGLPPGSQAFLPSQGLMYALACQGNCAPATGLAETATDVTGRDLAVGCNGLEFLALNDPAGGVEVTGSILAMPAGHPALTIETNDRPALLRPLFALGT